MAVKSAISSYAQNPTPTKGVGVGAIAAGVGILAATGLPGLLSVGIGTVRLLHATRKSNLPFFELKNDYNTEDVEAYLSIIFFKIGVCLEDLDDKENLVKNILDEISRVSRSGKEARTVSNALETILLHINKEISDVHERLPVETREEIKALNAVKPIPKTPPEKWVGRTSNDETPAHFIKRVYGEWMGKGLHTGHIRACDPTLGRAYDRWLESGKDKGPEGFHLPSKAEAIGAKPIPSDEDRRHARALLSRDRRAKQRNR